MKNNSLTKLQKISSEAIIHCIAAIILSLGSYQTFAQNSIPVLERNLNLQLSNTSIELVLNKIANLSGCKFSYSPSEIGSSRIVSVNAKDQSVREVLNSIFANRVAYKSRGIYIILQKKPEATVQKSRTVKGYVTDASTGKKIPNATIYDKKSLGSALSDDYGFYEIKLKNERALELNINKENYADTIIIVKQDPDELINVAIYPTKSDSGKIDKLVNSVKKSAVDFFISAKQKVNSLNVRDTFARRSQISFVPYFGTNGLMSGNVQNDFSLNVVAGYSQGTRILELGGVLNIARGNVAKVQLAGMANLVGGDVKGLQLAGFTNVNKKGFYGVQGAGFLNINQDTCVGVQLAGSININKNKFHGVQAAGLANLNAASGEGVQLAGFGNINQGNFRGVQTAGFLNTQSGTIKGLQLSGCINYATNLNGVQVGLINVSDSCKGLPIGFFSFVKSGYHRIEVAADEQLNYSLAFRTGTKKLYNIFSAATKSSTLQGKSELWQMGYGIGTSLQLLKPLQLNIDLIATQYAAGSRISSQQNVGKLLLTFDYYPLRKISIFAGPVINVAVLDQKDVPFYDSVNASLPKSMYTETFSNSTQLKAWLGFKAGLRFW